MFTGTEVGLRFKSTRGRGGVVENIVVERIQMEKITGDAIIFDLFYAGAKAPDVVPPADETTPIFRAIVLREIKCNGAKRAALFQGLPEQPLDNVRLESSEFTSNEGIVTSFVDGLLLQHVKVDAKSGPAVVLRDSRLVVANRLALTTPSGPLVSVGGARTHAITLPASFPSDAVRRACDLPESVVQRN